MPYTRDNVTGANQLMMNITLRNDNKWYYVLYESFVDADIQTYPNPMMGKVRLESGGPYDTYDQVSAFARDAIIAAGIDSLC